MNYAVGALGAKHILKEDVSGMRWAGALLICIGVLIVVTGWGALNELDSAHGQKGHSK